MEERCLAQDSHAGREHSIPFFIHDIGKSVDAPGVFSGFELRRSMLCKV